jgi:hypothetical protein
MRRRNGLYLIPVFSSFGMLSLTEYWCVADCLDLRGVSEMHSLLLLYNGAGFKSSKPYKTVTFIFIAVFLPNISG